MPHSFSTLALNCCAEYTLITTRLRSNGYVQTSQNSIATAASIATAHLITPLHGFACALSLIGSPALLSENLPSTIPSFGPKRNGAR
ncbi:MAG: hypothetical protein GXW96_00380 [Christensenellaceae bacterium]|nr:hypothetical protein [Christensenellaceae bacterium]